MSRRDTLIKAQAALERVARRIPPDELATLRKALAEARAAAEAEQQRSAA